ncbi:MULTISPECIES: DUF5798 family protein [Haloarcula]|nr:MULTISPECIES: DUF5798 family protein [Halomicroarcula]MBX0347933.1 hypothetical protein [Halomicroarcula pellucida]MDS0279948.1 DUF5798 family protein [Halomicroarcula sp. S1AR25-4]QIO23431.1 hypothetical protein G9465_14165 [Haloarcula sp. JP-L23]
MGFGSTAKKIQKVADVADKLYTKVNELKTQVQELRETVEDTNGRVDDVERQVAEQRALLEAIADEQGVDVDAVLTDDVERAPADAAETAHGEE